MVIDMGKHGAGSGLERIPYLTREAMHRTSWIRKSIIELGEEESQQSTFPSYTFVVLPS